MEAQYQSLLDEINNTKWTPDDEGFLLSAAFLKDFQDSIKSKFPPEIDNSSLKKKGKLCSQSLKQNVDYFVVSKKKWDELFENFGGSGPEIKCKFDIFGNAIIYPVKLVITFQQSKVTLETTKFLSFSCLVEHLRKTFNIPEEHIVNVFVPGRDSPIDPESKTIEPLVPYPDKIEVKVEIPKPKKENKQINTNKNKNKPKQQGNQPKKIVGLKNLGNTCYMNASIQCLLSLPTFLEKISTAKSGELSQAFAKLYKEIIKSKSAYDLKDFRQVFVRKVPLFDSTSQQDAHEFTLFLLDVLKDENQEMISPLFYGSDESTTICDKCNHSKTIVSKFSTLSLPISSSRKIIFSPWDLTKQMQRVSVIPDKTQPVILYGQKRTGYCFAEAFTPEFVDMLALEIPAHFDEEENEGLAIVELVHENKNSEYSNICRPIIMRAPLNEEIDPYSLEIAVWNRIEPLFSSDNKENKMNARKSLKLIAPPTKFTLFSTNTKSSLKYVVQEKVVVEIREPYCYQSYGFSDIRLTPLSTTISMEELITAYFSKTQLDPENKWKCEKCGDESCAYQQVSLIDTPENLIIQLKRFSIDNNITRDDSPVLIPNQINLTPYFKSPNNGDVIYNLIGIVDHRGSLESGHYFSLAKRANMWYSFNDSRVTEKDPPSTPSDLAYLLFFTRQHPPEKS